MIDSLLSHVGEMYRQLQEPTDAPTSAPTSPPAPVPPNDGEVLRDTLIVWGSIYLGVILLYGYLRNRYTRVFNLRSWVPHMRSDLADEFYGYFDWMWKLSWISDDEMRRECGLDALCFLRIFRFGFRISMVGCFNSIYLFPVYATAEVTDETSHITDPIASISVSNVPPESERFIATTVAAYIMFSFTMWLTLREFEWFTQQRHAWLTEKEARNYTVFVQGIPEEYRSSAKMLEYFQSCFHDDDVLEARVALATTHLESKVNKREALVWKLEHAINLEELKGTAPMLNNPLDSRGPRNAITVYAEELAILNDEISLEKAGLLAANDPHSAAPDAEGDNYSYARRSTVGAEGGVDVSMTDSAMGGHSVASSSVMGGNSVTSSLTGLDTAFPVTQDTVVVANDDRASTSKAENKFKDVGKLAGTMTNKMNATANAALSILKNEDGERKESGFVTFSSLSIRQAALQMVHHPKPFVMDVFEAPDADDIFWFNCGRTHKDLQLGKLLSYVLTALLCLFWTIPISFIVSLTNVEVLGEKVGFIGDLVEKNPWIGTFLTLIAPLLLIAIDELLEIILEMFCKLEGPISGSVVEASLFGKLSLFMIIQTFFVSAISGSIFAELKNIIDSPTEIVNLLATTLPGQSVFFLQIIVTQSVVKLTMQLLRISEIALAICRSFISPKLSEKERNKSVFFFRPLSAPEDFEYADAQSASVLYFMVLFVYGSTAPIVNWFLAVFFLLLIAGYRNQLVYCYPVSDSGGRLWISFMKIVPIAVFIGQLTLLGYLGLKLAGIAFILLIPLLITTFLFNTYIRQEHYNVLEYLPSRECTEKDKQNSKDGRSGLDFLKRAYLQPALLADDELQAENMSVAQEIAHTGAQYATPPGSEADIEPEEDIVFE